MSRTTSPLLALFLISLAGWIASCSDETSRPCTAGTTRLCAGVARCEGVQSCLADGSDYGACDCSGPPRQGEGGAPSDGASLSVVGRSCTEDAQCGAGLSCFTAASNDFFGGGPAGGYCSTACSTDASCTSIDRESACVRAGGDMAAPGLCERTCLSQDERSLPENKCLHRPNLVCQSEALLGLVPFSGDRQRGWCHPQCGSDEDCGGRRCDLSSGLCTDAPAPSGFPLGAACNANTQCASRSCVQIGGLAFCSANCVFGQPVGCGYGLTANPRDGFCLRPRVTGFTGAEGRGDMGLCAEICTVDADCEQAASGLVICDPSEEISTLFGRTGACDLPPAVADAGPDAADASVDASEPAPVTPDASTAADGG